MGVVVGLTRRPVVEVDGGPVRVVSVVERAAVDAELVREDQVVRDTLVGLGQSRSRVRGLWGVGVDEPKLADRRRHLTAMVKRRSERRVSQQIHQNKE